MRIIIFISFCLISLTSIAQKQANNIKNSPKPKLVVGIVVDQMRWDYVNKFKPFFKTQNGFLHFINEIDLNFAFYRL